MEVIKFMEQNPDKRSRYAKMAREGKKVMWVMKKGRYFAKWIEGNLEYEV